MNEKKKTLKNVTNISVFAWLNKFNIPFFLG